MVELVDIADDDVEVIDIADDDVEVIDIADDDDVEMIDIADDENEVIDIVDGANNVINIADNHPENFNVVDNIQQMDDAQIIDVVNDINFEDIMDEESVASEDSNYISDDCSEDSEDYIDVVEKHLTPAEVRAITARSKHCGIYFYYTTGGTYSVCAECIMRIADTDFGIMHAFSKHITNAFGRLDGKYCSNCRQPMFVMIPSNLCPVCTV